MIRRYQIGDEFHIRKIFPDAIFELAAKDYTPGQLGIVSLIAEGYGTLTWCFCFLYFNPLLTIGVWRLMKAG